MYIQRKHAKTILFIHTPVNIHLGEILKSYKHQK